MRKEASELKGPNSHNSSNSLKETDADLISMGDLAVHVKAARVQVVFAWANKGIRGIKLETIWIGGKRLTSWSAYTRWKKAVDAKRRSK